MSSLSLRSILTDGKLVNDNFHDWYQTLRIILMHEKLIDMIDKPLVPELGSNDDVERQHEHMDPTDIIAHLKKMYDAQSRTARYQLSKTLSRFMLNMNAHVGPHVLKMSNLMEQLEKLGCKLGKELSQDLILQSLLDSLSPFIINFNMNKMD
ncbi:PREDICTED: uncharacterized protein LOC109339099 [Lupinus angustifolius]|uniref:uncharacterized protein LOC109339099 n=1 Tax=Lupinus angustifolius TaxID=3871 RepID=UPI00092FB509|nr:PREDICTED: uncharacterized protein LOC109339099 [Lupinus angustifolius]